MSYFVLHFQFTGNSIEVLSSNVNGALGSALYIEKSSNVTLSQILVSQNSIVVQNSIEYSIANTYGSICLFYVTTIFFSDEVIVRDNRIENLGEFFA